MTLSVSTTLDEERSQVASIVTERFCKSQGLNKIAINCNQRDFTQTINQAFTGINFDSLGLNLTKNIQNVGDC